MLFNSSFKIANYANVFGLVNLVVILEGEA